MADKNITLVLHDKDDLRLEEKPIGEPGYGEVQIQMERVSICASDINFWKTGVMGAQKMTSPVALGHEGSGVVIKLGDGVTSLKVGDRVAIEPAITCLVCKYCKGSRYNMCPEVKGLATPGCDGHITRLFNHAADFCHKIPESMSFEEGALMEPLSVAVHSTTRGRIKMGDRVLIIGSGPIGLLCLMVAKARGAVSVCVTDINDQRLEFAQKIGADCVINIKGMTPEEVSSEVKARTGEMPDVTMECSGAPKSLSNAVYATAPAGVVVVLGMGNAVVDMPSVKTVWKELDILGSLRYKGSFPTAIAMVESGLVNIKPLITHTFHILHSLDAFRVAQQNLGIKVIIDCSRKPE